MTYHFHEPFQGPRNLSLFYFVGYGFCSQKHYPNQFVRVPESSPFTKRHGRLLSLVTSSFEEDMMSVLFQFFDLAHHCFTFPYYQLVPMIEELSKLLGVPILDQTPFIGLEKVPKPEDIAAALHLKRSDISSNWETRNGVEVLIAKFLIEKA